jgi:hypothetical protein
MNGIKAIETRYKGYRFRSRLEARWAVFFDALGLRWEYEKEGYDLGEFGWYLPDFWLPDVKMWAEVKPCPFSQEEYEKCNVLAYETNHNCLMLAGTPSNRAYKDCGETPYLLSVSDEYPFTESRFFSYPGCDCADHEGVGGCEWCHRDDTERAAEAARSARFEHGESPS